VATGVRSAAWAASRRGLDPRPLLDFAIWGVLAGVVVGHLVHVGLYHPEEIRSARRVLEFWDGLSSFGGLLGGILAAILFFRIRGVPLSRYGDAFAVGIPTGWAIARIGCFLVHDHPGRLTGFPLAVAFPTRRSSSSPSQGCSGASGPGGGSRGACSACSPSSTGRRASSSTSSGPRTWPTPTPATPG
jgi:prolipoprotein diacylglyceryltransferase